MAQRPRITWLAIFGIVVLAGCAAADPQASTVQTGVHCTKQAPTGRCIEWTVGPTPKQVEAFEARKRALEGGK